MTDPVHPAGRGADNRGKSGSFEAAVGSSPARPAAPPSGTSTPRLVLFTGIGIGSRLFLPQKCIPARIETPDYIDPLPDESVVAYSRRTAEGIDPTGPLYLGGVSFGGMVALEAAKVLRPDGVFLIASAYSYRALSRPVQLAGKLIAGTPPRLFEASLALAPLMLRLVGRPDRRQRRLMRELIAGASGLRATWGGASILEWTFEGKLGCPVYAIHGDRDRVVPIENVLPDHVVPGGGHIINVTHAGEVNRFLTQKMGLPTPEPPNGPAPAG